MNALAEKIIAAMAKASTEEWKALNAVLSALERGNSQAAQQWVDTGILPAVKEEKKPAKKRKPLDLAAPYTSIVLNVSFADKDRAKAAGAKWHPTRKFWYFPCYAQDAIPEAIRAFI